MNLSVLKYLKTFMVEELEIIIMISRFFDGKQKSIISYLTIKAVIHRNPVQIAQRFALLKIEIKVP